MTRLLQCLATIPCVSGLHPGLFISPSLALCDFCDHNSMVAVVCDGNFTVGTKSQPTRVVKSAEVVALEAKATQKKAAL